MYVMMLALLSLCAVSGAVGTFSPELHQKYMTMPLAEFVTYFNSLDYSWKMDAYEEEFKDGFPTLGVLEIGNSNNTSIDLKHEAIYKDLPETFDTREKWSNCPTISEIYDQGPCGSCWTFGVANTVNDRTCIHLNKNVKLSEMDFECCNNCTRPGKGICKGAIDMPRAFEHWQTSGLVTDRCKPYDIKNGNGQFPHCSKQCIDPSINYENDKHYGASYDILAQNENEIKAELFKNGPIQASFNVFRDFKLYKGGIYEHKFGIFSNGHSVRVLGYGVEKGVKYWLVANSWGSGWGDQGLVKIKTFQPELKFESEMVAPVPKN